MLQPRTARRSRTPLLALLAVALVAACTQGPSPNSKDRSPSPSPSPLALPTPLPPGFTAPGTDASPPRPTLLMVVPATGLKVGALHQAAFPDRTQALALAQTLVHLPVQTAVQPLLTDNDRLKPGAVADIAAGNLPESPHDVLFVLTGPGVVAQHLVRTAHGVAVGKVTLPSRLGPGSWSIAAIDSSQLSTGADNRVVGTVVVSVTTFIVAG
jgi:hypothetical protein